MLFSIIVPVYNVEKYIRECIDSIINQSYSDYEIILVDDGSTDDSGNICDEYAEKNTCITVIHKQNEGLLLARRTGLKVARGDYCMHCDSDDYYAKDTLSEISKVIDQKHPDMILFGYNVVDDERNVIEEHYDVFPDGTIINENNREELLLKLSTTTWLNNMVTKVTRRDCIDIDTDYNEYKSIKMGEDLFQVIPLIRKCCTFIYLANPLYCYRYNPGGISKKINWSYLDNYLTVSNRMSQLLENEEVTEKVLILFYNRFTKDVLKYLLRFIKAGIKEKDYVSIYENILKDKVVREALRRYDEWSMLNKILGVIVKPCNRAFAFVLVNTILVKKL